MIIDKNLYVGVDEVGVGENVGPYVSCAISYENYESKKKVVLKGIKDSKKMKHLEIIKKLVLALVYWDY